jgi:hypothetical protein
MKAMIPHFAPDFLPVFEVPENPAPAAALLVR